MMRTLVAAGLAAATFVLAPAPATAGPLNLRSVAPDAQFIVHLDMEAMRESEAGRAMLEIISNAADDGFEEMRNELGIDPRENVDSATVYGVDDDEAGMVIIVRGNGALAEALDKARGEVNGVDERSRGGVDFEAWDGDDDELFVFEASRRDATTVVIAFQEDRLVRAVRLLAGDEEGLRGDAADAFGDLDDGAFIFVSAVGAMGLDDLGEASNLLKLSDRIVVQVAGDETLDFHLEMTTQSHDDARNLVGLVQGGLAIARIAISQEDVGTEDDRDALLALTDKIEIDSEGRSVTIRASIDPDWLAKIIDERAD